MKVTSLALLILLGSCTFFRSTSSNSESNIQNPRIIFLNYKISKNTDGELDVQLINKVIKEGKLKPRINEILSPKIGDIKCLQLDRKQKVIESIYLTNPLIKDIEYIDSTKSLNKKTFYLDSAEFSVRMQLSSKSKYISIEKVDKIKISLSKEKL